MVLLFTRAQFQGGFISKYAPNLIAENVYSQIDPDGNEFLILNDILDNISTDKAMKPKDAFEGDPVKRNYKRQIQDGKY